MENENNDNELVEALKKALALHDKGHALDAFDWGKSALTGENIAELNNLPGIIRAALRNAGVEA